MLRTIRRGSILKLFNTTNKLYRAILSLLKTSPEKTLYKVIASCSVKYFFLDLPAITAELTYTQKVFIPLLKILKKNQGTAFLFHTKTFTAPVLKMA